jgi:hypothetical protein
MVGVDAIICLTMSQDPINDRAAASALQFGTRTLLIGTALCAVLVLVLQHVSAVWGMTILWLLLLIAAHVAANMRGAHKSREASGFERSEANGAGFSIVHRPMDVAQACAPATRLRDHRRFGRMLLIVTLATACVGWLAGTAALVLATPADPGGIVLGGVSAAVLGGFLGFVSASFAMVATRSFREAVDEHRFSPASRAGDSA